MAEWNHQFNGREFEKTLGDSERQGSLACCSPWSHSGLDTMSNRTTTGDSVRPLGQEDPLEEEMATHSNIFAWEKNPWTEEPGRLQSMGVSESQT